MAEQAEEAPVRTPTQQDPEFAIRTSSRSTFKRCIQRWHWSYVDGLRPKGLPSRALWFGTGIHLALSEWYGTGQERLVHPLETWEEFTRDSMVSMRVQFDHGQGIESEWVDAIDLGKAMLTAYLEEYGNDEQWDFIATEQAGKARIQVPFGSGTILYYYTFDGVYRDLEDGSFKLLETKTASSIGTEHLTLDDQAGSYWAIASAKLRRMGLLGPKERIGGITYNFLRKAMPDSRPVHPVTGKRCNKPTKENFLSALLKEYSPPTLADMGVSTKTKLAELQQICEDYGLEVFGEESKSQPTPLFLRHFVERVTSERNAQIRRIRDEAVAMHLVQTGVLPILKTPRASGYDACRYGCEFFQMCELHEAGREWEVYRDAMYKTIDPWAEYAKSAQDGA